MSDVVSARAPVRLDFAGGWTDVPPFSEREGGVVVNAALRLYAHAGVAPGGQSIRIVSEDLDTTLDVSGEADLAPGGPLHLLKAAVRCHPLPGPYVLTTRCDAPGGSGLGGSGAMDVALVAALTRARGEQLEPVQIAERAWRLEAVEAGIAGGKQDQYAAALGGFHRLTFNDPAVGCERLELDPDFLAELGRHTVLCYTGRSRLSGDTISRVIGEYARGDRAITGAFRGMKDVAEAMAEALRAADIGRVGTLLDENWRHQQRLDPVMRTPEMARLELAMRDAGLLGGKAAGSGAGGCMFFLVRRPERAREAARNTGATVLPVEWDAAGGR